MGGTMITRRKFFKVAGMGLTAIALPACMLEIKQFKKLPVVTIPPESELVKFFIFHDGAEVFVERKTEINFDGKPIPIFYKSKHGTWTKGEMQITLDVKWNEEKTEMRPEFSIEFINHEGVKDHDRNKINYRNYTY
jgi:hypothetical protein